MQAGRLSIQTPFLLRKMLVGNSQTLCDLHRTAAGCAFLPNAFFDGVHGSVIYPPGTDPLKKSADNDFVSTHCNLFTSL